MSELAGKKYRIRLRDGVNSIYINPTGTIQVSWELVEGTFYYAPNLNSFKLSGVDYEWVKEIETAGDICKEIDIEVERRCNNQWSLYILAKFTVQDCTFNNSKCNIIVNPDPKNLGECLLSRANDTLDLFEEINPTTTPGIDSFAHISDALVGDALGYDNGRIFFYNDPALHEVLIKPALDSDGNPTPDPTVGELLEADAGIDESERELIKIEFIGSVQGGVLTPKWNIFVAWAYRRTEFKAPLAPCPETPPGYTLIDSTATFCLYQKRPTDADQSMFPAEVEECPQTVGGDDEVIYSGAVPNDDYPAGFCAKLIHKDQNYSYLTLSLNRVLQTFIDKCDDLKRPVSNFFQINPETPSTVNYVTGLPTKTNDIRFIQKSNAIFPLFGDAVTGEMSWSELESIMKESFQNYWTIDVDGNLRFEHFSFFENTVIGLDLTVPKFSEFVNEEINYSYKKESLPFIETIQQGEWHNYNFNIRTIKYVDPDGDKLGCVGTGSLDHGFGNFFTDLDFYVEYPTDVPRNGWVMVAVKEDSGVDYIIDEDGLLNGHLSIKRLVENYYQHGRSAITAKLNGFDVTFKSSVKLKTEEDLGFPICCDDQFDPRQNIKAPNGVGRVISATHDLKENKLTLSNEYE